MITRRADGYEIDTDPGRVDVEQSIRASVNFGVYAEYGQVGYAAHGAAVKLSPTSSGTTLVELTSVATSTSSGWS